MVKKTRLRKLSKGFYKLSNIKIYKGLEVRNVKRRTVDSKIDPLDTMNSKFIYLGDVYYKGKKIKEIAFDTNNKEEFVWWIKKDKTVKKIRKSYGYTPLKIESGEPRRRGGYIYRKKQPS